MFKGKRMLREGNTAISFLICFAFSVAVMILLALIFALVANMSEDPTGKLGIFSISAMIISAIIGGVFTMRFSKSNLGLTALVALAIVLVMLLFCIVLNAGKITASAFMNYACYLGISVFSGFIGKQKEGHKRHRR